MNQEPKRRGRPKKSNIETLVEMMEYEDNMKDPVEITTELRMASPTCWASLEATINLGNYQNEKISVGLAGVPIDATPEEVETLLESGKEVITMVVDKLAEKMANQIQALGGFRF